MTADNPIRNVSDTASWVAVYRAMESERPDAHFNDPYARRLAGERGQAIVDAMPRGRMRQGAKAYLTKPFSETELAEVITSYLSAAGAA